MNTKTLKARLCRPLAITPALALLFSTDAHAIDAAGIDVHGSVSVTASYSDTYNYLGNTSKNPDLNLVDVIVNGTHRFENGLRVGAQVYGYTIGDYSDVTLDWANLDYSFKPWFGVRLGRNKLPMGLYNDSQDLDSVRTFASLPITFYPKTFRAITSAFDGLSLYGNIGLGRGGSVDYQVFGGTKQDVNGDAPFVRGTSNLTTYSKWDFQAPVFGTSLFWNTPIEGLRLGYSITDLPKGSLRGVLAQSKDMRDWALGIPAMVDGAMGAGAWDNSGLFAGTPSDTLDMKVLFQVYSAEYTRGKWLFAGEYKLIDVTKGYDHTPAFAMLHMPVDTPYSAYMEEYYGMVTYQATEKLGLGLYYSYENVARRDPGSSSNPAQYTKDCAAAVSYALNRAWIVKLEGHLMNGRSQTFTAGDDNRTSGIDNSWTYLVVKATFSF